ncbi:unnamed protein product [Dibothriocephalus latus]|uniref:Uncharacterized protein n=1 Tax=Dibothriocephalus latus TaxID=60516 RepID=A0A3P6PD91_DIBLA|nr:unnamed protein product [Dibothriocephalus latus]
MACLCVCELHCKVDKNKIYFAVGLGCALLFLILALALSSWRCGTVLDTCLNGESKESYRTVGALLFCAILVNLVAFTIVIVGCMTSFYWTTPVALGLTWIGGILALAGIAFYFDKLDPTYSPLLAVVGMSFTWAIAITISITMIHERVF